MAPFAPIIVAGVFVAVFVCIILFIYHKKRVIKEQDRRRRRYQKQAEAQQQRLYTFPHFSPDELDAAPPFPKVHIHQSHPRDQQQQQRKNQDDIHRVAANLLNSPSGQQVEQQQQPQQSPPSPQQQCNRAVNLPRTSPDSHPSSPFLELSPLPAAYQQQGSSRRNPDRSNNSPASHSFSSMQPQESGTLPSAPRANGSGGDDDVGRRAGNNYLVQPSPLPRPLHLRRPIVTDTSITPSSKVVATIGRGVPLVVQDDESNSPIEPPVVIIGKSPVLMALGANMLAHSPSSATATTESYKATLPAKSTARRESIRRQTTTTTQTTPTQIQVSLSEAQTKTQTQTQQRTPHQQGGVQFPTPIAEEQDFADESDNPFMSKEEFKRPAPQAILPEGFKHAQFTLPLPPVPSQGNKFENYSSDDDSIDLDTGRLVLEPYLTPAELAAHVPFPAPAVPYKYAKDSAPSSSAAAAADQLVNQNAAPIRPPRRTTDASDQPNLSQSKIQEQRLQQPQQQLPQSAHPLASSADAPWPLVHRSPSPAPAPSAIPSHRPPPLSSSPSPAPIPSPSPSPTQSSLSNKSSNSTIRVKQLPPTLPPPRGIRSGSSSQTESERGMSPAPSLSYTSSNISTGLSIISSQPDTIITESFVTLGDTPPTTVYMFCDSPGSPPVLSPTSSTFTGRSFSVSTIETPATPRFAPGHSPPIVEGNDYGWATEKGDDDENYKVAVPQAKRPRVPEAVGGGTRLSHFNYDV